MKKYILVFTVFLFIGASIASANIPQDVLTPYKAYNQALKSKNYVTAKEHAYEAWQAAEKHLGDHKSTGDLAMNFATLPVSILSEDPQRDHKRREKALKRAIKLAKLYDKDAGLIEVQRRIDLIDLQLTFSKRMVTFESGAVFDKTRHGKISELKKLEKAIAKYDLQNSTFDDDLQTLFARYHQLNKRPEPALGHLKKAIEIFESRTDDYISPYSYLAYTYKGNIHRERAQKDDNPTELIKAALAYQVVKNNKIGDLPDTHSFISTAAIRCKAVMGEIKKAGLIDEAVDAGVKNC